MNAQNAKIWTGITGLAVACPSLFCCAMGLGTLLGGGTYELGSSSGQMPPWVGVPLLCLSLLPWLLPIGVWRYASKRPAPTDFEKLEQKGQNQESYSPFTIDPNYDADASTSSTDSDV